MIRNISKITTFKITVANIDSKVVTLHLKILGKNKKDKRDSTQKIEDSMT